MTKKAKGQISLGRSGERSAAFPGESQSLVPTVSLYGLSATEPATNMKLQPANGGLVYDGNELPIITAPTIPGITDDATGGELDALQEKEGCGIDPNRPVSLIPQHESAGTLREPTTPSVTPLQNATTFDVNGTLSAKEQALLDRQESRRRKPDRRPPRH